MKFDKPPGRQEHQKFKEHTMCLAYQTTNGGRFFESIDFYIVKQCVLPIAVNDAKRYNSDMDSELAFKTRLMDTISDTHRLAREVLKDLHIFIY